MRSALPAHRQETIDPQKPTLLLNAHIDTVKPVATWTRDPYKPMVEDGRLYGLGANDCGGGLVSLLQVYRLLRCDSTLHYNLVFLASCEEEVGGAGGFSLALPHLPRIDVAIVGEPTGMQPAIAEKGLMVIDAVAHGRSGHAARNEGVNAIYEALDDLLWLRDYRPENNSMLLGPTKLTVTIINSGTHLRSELKARSFRLSSSHIPESHPLVLRCLEMGMTPFGSPTLSDQALMPFPSLKLGPGESSRSHSADEFIRISEIQEAIEKYVRLLGR